MGTEWTMEMVEEQRRRVAESSAAAREALASEAIDDKAGKHTCGPSCTCRDADAGFAARAAARAKPAPVAPTPAPIAPRKAGEPQSRWTLTVPGCPVSKGRPQFAGTPVCPKCKTKLPRPRAFTPADTVAAEKAIRGFVAMNHPPEPFAGKLIVRLRFYLPDHRRIDADNLVKLCLDAMNPLTLKVREGDVVHREPILDGAVWRDDSQIHRLTAEKLFDADNPRTEIEVEAMPLPGLPLFAGVAR